MNLFDGEIKKMREALMSLPSTIYQYNAGAVLTTHERPSLVLMRDCSFELGGGGLPAAGLTVVSSDISFPTQTVVVGRELSDISQDAPFAKIELVTLSDEFLSEQATYDAVKELQYLRYKLNISGFMARASAMNHREQVRVSREAIKDGLSFSAVGNTIINAYLKFPYVKSAEVVFITAPEADYGAITRTAEKCEKILGALNHVLDDVNFDCDSCNLKVICDEVEGLREMHMRKR